jgi:hypothetical protein
MKKRYIPLAISGTFLTVRMVTLHPFHAAVVGVYSIYHYRGEIMKGMKELPRVAMQVAVTIGRGVAKFASELVRNWLPGLLGMALTLAGLTALMSKWLGKTEEAKEIPMQPMVSDGLKQRSESVASDLKEKAEERQVEAEKPNYDVNYKRAEVAAEPAQPKIGPKMNFRSRL